MRLIGAPSGEASISRREWRWLGMVLGLGLLLGAVLAPDFGQSTDEYANFEYAANSLRAYLGSEAFVGPAFQELHGPFHLEVAYLAGEAIVRLPIGWTRTDGRHLANFIVFLLGVGGVYVLCRRGVPPLASAGAAALFASQPLLWGQAFINQKDSPFMATFILAMAAGLSASDRLAWRGAHPSGAGAGASRSGLASLRSAFEADTADVSRAVSVLTLLAFGGLLLVAVASLAGWVFLPSAKALLSQAYAGGAVKPIQILFDRIATDAYKTPLSIYFGKLELIYAWTKVPFALAWLSAACVLVRWRMPAVWHSAVRRFPDGLGALLVAGGILGLADSMRVAAPLAGALVAGYLLLQHGRWGWLPVGAYGLTALVTTYLTWPWLWRSPLSAYLQALKVMSAYPSHRVLFGGQVYASRSLPWDYVPRLTAIQTTEIVLPLFALGLGVALWRAARAGASWADLALWGLWLVTPVGLAIAMHSSLYGNLRQMLFVLPPLFVVAGFAIDELARRVRLPAWRPALAVMLLGPGIAGIVRLHPYEDSYFNAWVGWTSGAFGRYQVDPWCTSYRQAVAYLNETAAPGSVVDVRGPFQSAEDFARADLAMHPDFDKAADPDFALMCQVDILGDGFMDQLPILYRVTRGRAVLSVVRGSP
jgi:hypothetical protein